MLQDSKRTSYTPCAEQAVWTACQKMRRTAMRLAAMLHKILTRSSQSCDVICTRLAHLMGLERPPFDVAVILRGTRRTDTLEEAARGLDVRVSVHKGLGLIKEQMGLLAKNEGLLADKEFAFDMAQLARDLLLRQKRGQALPDAPVARMAMALIRPA